VINVWVVEELFYYKHPFYLPNLFQSNFTKHEFEGLDLIESNYKIIQNGRLYKVEQLTTRNISQGLVIYEKLSI
jgi:hypothetical protein